MSRNDSALYTGISSAAFATPKSEQLQTKRAEDKQKRLDEQHKLLPAADLILPIIQKHKDAAKFVENVSGGSELTDKAAGELLRSQRLVYRFLLQFEKEIKVVLKDAA